MIVAGLGLRGAATVASLRDALERAFDAAEACEVRLVRRVHLLATAQDKLGSPCLDQLAVELGVSLRGVRRELLERTPTLTDNPVVRQLRGGTSVAEAAALAAALLCGATQPRLLGPRAISTDALTTCALAVFEHPGGLLS